MRRGANLQGLTRASCRARLDEHTDWPQALSGGGSAVDTLPWPRHWLGSGPCPCSSQPCTEEPRRSEWLRPGRRDDDVVLGSSLSYHLRLISSGWLAWATNGS